MLSASLPTLGEKTPLVSAGSSESAGDEKADQNICCRIMKAMAVLILLLGVVFALICVLFRRLAFL